jgi:hypothetical protein
MTRLPDYPPVRSMAAACSLSTPLLSGAIAHGLDSRPSKVPVLHPLPALWFFALIEPLRSSNKALEPTTTAVMPRASLPVSEVKQRTEDRNPARVTPAVVVAHL